MEIQEQIRIVKDLLEAVTEFNGECQEGWEKTIEGGENLLSYLQNIITDKEHKEMMKSLCPKDSSFYFLGWDEK